MGDYVQGPDLVRVLSELSSRIAALERTRQIPVAAGAPSSAAPDGALQVDSSANRLYVRVGGSWKFTALT